MMIGDVSAAHRTPRRGGLEIGGSIHSARPVASSDRLSDRDTASDLPGRGGRGRSRNPHRDGVRPEGGGQPHRQRRNRPGGEAAAARPEKTYNPMAGEKTTPREPRPESEMTRRPRRRPSNGGKGYGAAKA